MMETHRTPGQGQTGRPANFDAGILLISFAVLLVELLLTRIFSVTMFYHLSFMVVSLAMLGFGVSGLMVNLLPERFSEDRLRPQLAACAILFAVTAVIAVGVAFRLPISLETSARNWARIATVYVLCAVPFLCGGLVVSLILTHRTTHANRLYFFDLLGAALACLAFIPATNVLGAPTAVLLAAVVACVAGAVFAGSEARVGRDAAVGLALALTLLGIANTRFRFYDLRFIKGHRQPPTLAMKWNSFSRVDVVGTPMELWTPRPPVFAGYSATLDPNFRIAEAWLRYDADAATQITRFDGDLGKLAHLGFDVSSSVYQMRTYRDVLVIGPGGGRDILTALHMGSGPVTGVEINPITLQLMRTRFLTFTGGLYNHYPGVRMVNDEGRSFLRHSTEKFGVIQASLVDTWAASAAGAYALTENNLYTVEAFQDYLRHLAPGGVVSFTRWFSSPPLESLRVVSLAVEALRREGLDDPSRAILVVRTNPDDTFLASLGAIMVKPSGFAEDEIERLRAWAKKMGFFVDYAPDDVALGVTPNDFHGVVGDRSGEFVASYPFDISPVRDDRPFFFSSVPLVPWIGAQLGLTDSPVGNQHLGLGAQTLLISLTVTAVATFLILLMPLVVHWRRPRPEQRPKVASARALAWAVYFAGLGLGFILVEIVLVQRFGLFLGYPAYSLSVVLFTMLLSSSIGSLVSGRWSSAATLPGIVAVVCAFILVYAGLLPRLLQATLGAETPYRILVAVLAIAPLGFFMGMPFPTGLRRAALESKGLVSWAWAVNGGASVFGSTLTVLISMTYGFTASFLCGAAAYAIALAMALAVLRPGGALEVATGQVGDDKPISKASAA
jgi:SAM-dependent methyltransferase